MKRVVTAAEAAAVVAYALWGMVVVNDLGLVAGSGMSLDEAILAMDASGQPVSMIPGRLFLVAGIALAAAWTIIAPRRLDLGACEVTLGWCVALTLGAPAYFAASFWNLMSLADTFYDGNMDAVVALGRPLYVVSTTALTGAIALAVLRPAGGRRMSHLPASTRA
ncbi:hypothetical protein [Tessaracoccus caeni]|uniref:hypothetical protein n=1 Tax=Tessaracoccus caeni TaxID=3031239 RepID=UPI0023DC5A57|nr:hypothetical protein [Tessaracoccus caeni]MDF1487043.1 hypothetical protein [Tessaracoccus caeni]